MTKGNVVKENAVVLYVQPDIDQLIDMLSYRRAEGSVYQKHFCKKFLAPVFDECDAHGNYIHVINDPYGLPPRIAFMAHHDTVHILDGSQTVKVEGDIAKLPPFSRSTCLGADCTTGVWLILHMIKNNVPGRYVVHAGEEIGLQGSMALVKSRPLWLEDVEIAISFDRKGNDSIITHQCARRTCSDKFAWELNAALGGGFSPDNTGTYTDSEAYAEEISECTNLSVGYYNQHSKNETQDLAFAKSLADKLVMANWGNVRAYRDPLEYDSDWDYSNYGVVSIGGSASYSEASTRRNKKSGGWRSRGIASPEDLGVALEDKEVERKYNGEVDPDDTIEDICLHYPSRVADWLRNAGVTKEMIISDLGLWEESTW